jgi:hypothetical protein
VVVRSSFFGKNLKLSARYLRNFLLIGITVKPSLVLRFLRQTVCAGLHFSRVLQATLQNNIVPSVCSCHFRLCQILFCSSQSKLATILSLSRCLISGSFPTLPMRITCLMNNESLIVMTKLYKLDIFNEQKA